MTQLLVSTDSYRTLNREYIAYLGALGYQPSTIRSHDSGSRLFLCFAEQRGIFRVRLFGQKLLEDYKNYVCSRAKLTLNGSCLKNGSVQNLLTIVNRFIHFLHHCGLVKLMPYRSRDFDYESSAVEKILTQKQIQILYDTVGKTFPAIHKNDQLRQAKQMTTKLMLDLCYGCGLRRSEVINVRKVDVNLDQNFIHVRKAKNYRQRNVPFNANLRDAFRLYLYQYRRHFELERHDERRDYLYPQSVNTLAYSLRSLINLCDNQSIQDKAPSLHSLRHSIATHLLHNGMDIETISQFLGHTSLGSTQIYTHIIDQS